MRVADILLEDALDDVIAKIRQALAVETSSAPNVDTTAPAQPVAPGGEGAAAVTTPGSDIAQRGRDVTRSSSPQQLATPQGSGSGDSVVDQTTAQQTWNARYPADSFVQGMPAQYYQAVEALSGDLSPQNVQRLEDVVQNDTPNEIVQVLYRRLVSNQGYSKQDLEDAVEQGTAGGFSQAEIDGARQLLDYLRRLEMRINQ